MTSSAEPRGCWKVICSARNIGAKASVQNLAGVLDNIPGDHSVELIDVGPTNHHVFGFLFSQVIVAIRILRERKRISIGILFVGATCFTLPVLVLKALRIPVILIAPGSAAKAAYCILRSEYGALGSLVAAPFRVLEETNYRLADTIVTEAPSIAEELGLGKFKPKLLSEGALAVDVSSFKPMTKISEREDVIGFCGRLSSEKGFGCLVDSLREILERLPTVRVHIVGDGHLHGYLLEQLRGPIAARRIRLDSWIPKSQLPAYFNSIKLLVVPSFTEGMPLAPLEAMACGTLVLASSVGGLPSAIQHERNGFLLESNAPNRIADSVISVLARPDLEKISVEAVEHVRKSYDLGAAISHYGLVILRTTGFNRER